jgi:hypothetical protein
MVIGIVERFCVDQKFEAVGNAVFHSLRYLQIENEKKTSLGNLHQIQNTITKIMVENPPNLYDYFALLKEFVFIFIIFLLESFSFGYN